MEQSPFIQLGIALLIGLLVGLQRERTESSVAGIRTFPLIAAFGTICAWLAETYSGWILAAGLLALAGALVVGNLARLKAGDVDPGLTTEVSVLLLFAVGAYLVVGTMSVAVALGGVIALLLHYKKPLHDFVERIGETDVKAIMQFALVTLVILPVLPNRAYGPFAVLNPFEIWLMVVLIVGISVAGYVAFLLGGAKTGTLVGGLIGGMVSSTATTASFARRSTDTTNGARLAALVIMIASSSVFIRVLIEVVAVAPRHLARMAPPLAGMLVACSLIATFAYRSARMQSAKITPTRNPAELKWALLFGALYAVIIFAVAAAKTYLGSAGLFGVAIISGLTDMDAITLSTAQLTRAGRLDADQGWRLILVASMSNLVFKAGIVALLGSRELLRHILRLFGLALAAGAAILWLWPA